MSNKNLASENSKITRASFILLLLAILAIPGSAQTNFGVPERPIIRNRVVVGTNVNGSSNTVTLLPPRHILTATNMADPLRPRPSVPLAWSPWTEVPTEMTTDAAVSCAAYRNNLYLFAKRAGDNRIFYNTFNGKKWSSWREVPGDGITDASMTATAFNGSLYLFAKGIEDKALYQNHFSGAKWSGWSAVPGGAKTDVAPDAVDYGGYLYLFRKGLGETNTYFNALNLGGWTGWVKAPTNLLTDTSIAATMCQKNLFVFTKRQGTDRIYLITRSGTDWGQMVEVPGQGLTDAPLAACGYDRQVLLFGKGITDRGVYLNRFDGAAWGGWSAVPGAGLTIKALASCEFLDKAYLFKVDPNRRVFYSTTLLRSPPVAHVDEITNIVKVTKGFAAQLPPEVKPGPPDPEEAELFAHVINYPVEKSFMLAAGAAREFTIQVDRGPGSVVLSVNSFGSAKPVELQLTLGGNRMALSGTNHIIDENRANVVAITKVPERATLTAKVLNSGTNSITVEPAIDLIK